MTLASREQRQLEYLVTKRQNSVVRMGNCHQQYTIIVIILSTWRHVLCTLSINNKNYLYKKTKTKTKKRTQKKAKTKLAVFLNIVCRKRRCIK